MACSVSLSLICYARNCCKFKFDTLNKNKTQYLPVNAHVNEKTFNFVRV